MGRSLKLPASYESTEEVILRTASLKIPRVKMRLKS